MINFRVRIDYTIAVNDQPQKHIKELSIEALSATKALLIAIDQIDNNSIIQISCQCCIEVTLMQN